MTRVRVHPDIDQPTWLTMFAGMSRLPNAFKPFVKDDLKYNRKIQKVEYLDCDKQVRVSWKNHFTDRHFQSATYDYAVVAVPFTVARKWELPGNLVCWAFSVDY